MCVNQMEKDPLKKMESSNNDRVNGARQSICCMESYTTTQSPLLLVLSPAGASFLCRSPRNLSARASFVSLRRVAAALWGAASLSLSCSGLYSVMRQGWDTEYPLAGLPISLVHGGYSLWPRWRRRETALLIPESWWHLTMRGSRGSLLR